MHLSSTVLLLLSFTVKYNVIIWRLKLLMIIWLYINDNVVYIAWDSDGQH